MRSLTTNEFVVTTAMPFEQRVARSSAKTEQGSRQYAYLRIDVASAQIFAQNRNFASRKQTAQTQLYVIRDT